MTFLYLLGLVSLFALVAIIYATHELHKSDHEAAVG